MDQEALETLQTAEVGFGVVKRGTLGECNGTTKLCKTPVEGSEKLHLGGPTKGKYIMYRIVLG